MSLDYEFNLLRKKQDEILSILKEMQNSSSKDCEEAIYDLTDLEKKLKVSRRTLFKYLSSGLLEHSKVGKKIYISEEQLQNFFNKVNYDRV